VAVQAVAVLVLLQAHFLLAVWQRKATTAATV
jgi:hypothetical protein